MDDLDRAILGRLVADGRATFRDIGADVGLSASAVKRRVDQMTRRGQIAGFTAVVDPEVLGWTTEAYVEVYYRGNVSTAQLARSLAEVPQITGAWTVSGDADALVHVRAASMAEIERTVERIREHPKVDRTRSAIVMSRVLERPDVRI
ncbi:AsnC family transcriptional regulator [Nocardioides sp. MAH-18]|uniref:AsnC family transcriptional regulator n=1 Tax=Nocardioides agri TaxID=2682843 RepID=A0A6L6XTJ8_9ACTN|nr:MULTISPECIES: Lrp/AsnC family transcriptional regulator [unclassified Nocardioides]MBA2955478.1 Lrp/AsnC family transcriptional regulator [Nocardioides sp. CGMCC 1.13656]MVQ50328.1 AsnC family transcriptional regulator [Nocardioides sp. MAH-18]